MIHGAILRAAQERILRSLRTIEPQSRSALARVARVEPDQLDRVLDDLVGERLARKEMFDPGNGAWPYGAYWLTPAGRMAADRLAPAEPEKPAAPERKQGQLF